MPFGCVGRLHETFKLELWQKGNNKSSQQELRKNVEKMKDEEAKKILKETKSIEFVNVYLKFKISLSVVDFVHIFECKWKNCVFAIKHLFSF